MLTCATTCRPCLSDKATSHRAGTLRSHSRPALSSRPRTLSLKPARVSVTFHPSRRSSSTTRQLRQVLSAVAVEAADADEADKDEDLCPTKDKTCCPLTREDLFEIIREEAIADAKAEPALASMLYSTIISHNSLTFSISFVLANKLGGQDLNPSQLVYLFRQTFDSDPPSKKAMLADLCAVYERDPACEKYSQCLLYFKGFQAIQAQRVAHLCWKQGRRALAVALQSRISEVFQVDIHPAARIGSGILMDHATGIVIGETAVVGNNVSILHGVTLGGTGAETGDRHPKVEDGVLIGAGVSILGNVRIGEGSKIGAGSVVLKDIPPHETAVGVPAKILKAKKLVRDPSMVMDQTSFADYCI